LTILAEATIILLKVTILHLAVKRLHTNCEKTPNQKDVIASLPAGAEAEFSFEEIAFYFSSETVPPEKLPEKMEIKIESFDMADAS